MYTAKTALAMYTASQCSVLSILLSLQSRHYYYLYAAKVDALDQGIAGRFFNMTFMGWVHVEASRCTLAEASFKVL